jgi:hypothetical protein
MSVTIQLVEGVTGGFIAPVPRKQIIIDWTSTDCSITRSVRSNAANASDGYLTFNSAATLESSVLLPLVTKTLEIFKGLPMEKPTASRDVYGFDVSISIVAPGLKWQNTPNQGCSITESSIVPNEEQRTTFKQIADEIELVATNYATVPAQ